MFFSCSQAGGVQTIVKWVALSRTYRLVLGLLLSSQYSVRMYEENSFANMISSAETFHRMRFDNELMPKADFKSYKRKMAKAVTKELGRRARDWINKQLEHSNEPRLRQRLVYLESVNFT